jgi:Skp family chaperone for outer membrane proteins
MSSVRTYRGGFYGHTGHHGTARSGQGNLSNQAPISIASSGKCRVGWAGAFALLAVLTMSTGCQEASSASATPPPRGGVAIVDLDEVARRTGRDQQMLAKIDAFRQQKNDEVAAAQAELQKKLEAFQASLGEHPTPEQQQQLALVQRKLAADFAAISQQATAAVQQFKQDTIKQYRDDVRPLAREIAASRGLQVVITHQDSFQLAVDPQCDITDELATRLKTPMAAVPASDAQLSQR